MIYYLEGGMVKVGLIKGMIGLVVAVPLAGAAIGGIGSSMVGGLAGIGGAAQSMVGVGLFSHAAKLSKGIFKW